VYAADLGYAYQNNRVAIIEYGSRLGLPVVAFSLPAYWDAHYRGRPWYRERDVWGAGLKQDRPPKEVDRPKDVVRQSDLTATNNSNGNTRWRLTKHERTPVSIEMKRGPIPAFDRVA
jgi:hypothetical protein